MQCHLLNLLGNCKIFWAKFLTNYGGFISQFAPGINTTKILLCSDESQLSIGGISLAFQIIKGIWLLVISLDGMSKKSRAKRLKYISSQRTSSSEDPRPEASRLNDSIPTICATLNDNSAITLSDDNLKNCWDPLQPAYEMDGSLKNKAKKVSWAYNFIQEVWNKSSIIIMKSSIVLMCIAGFP